MDIYSHHRITTLFLLPKRAACALEQTLKCGGCKSEITNYTGGEFCCGRCEGEKKIVTHSSLPARAGHMHIHFTGPDSALSYSGTIVLLPCVLGELKSGSFPL